MLWNKFKPCLKFPKCIGGGLRLFISHHTLESRKLENIATKCLLHFTKKKPSLNINSALKFVSAWVLSIALPAAYVYPNELFLLEQLWWAEKSFTWWYKDYLLSINESSLGLCASLKSCGLSPWREKRCSSGVVPWNTLYPKFTTWSALGGNGFEPIPAGSGLIASPSLCLAVLEFFTEFYNRFHYNMQATLKNKAGRRKRRFLSFYHALTLITVFSKILGFSIFSFKWSTGTYPVELKKLSIFPLTCFVYLI